MGLTSIQQPENQDVVNYIGLHVWALVVGGIYLGGKFDIFAWQWKVLFHPWN